MKLGSFLGILLVSASAHLALCEVRGRDTFATHSLFHSLRETRCLGGFILSEIGLTLPGPGIPGGQTHQVFSTLY